MRRSWRTSIAAAGVEVLHRFHDNRAAYITDVARLGSSAITKNLARHASMATTEGYTGLVDQDPPRRRRRRRLPAGATDLGRERQGALAGQRVADLGRDVQRDRSRIFQSWGASCSSGRGLRGPPIHTLCFCATARDP